jgi:hypothetical protein
MYQNDKEPANPGTVNIVYYAFTVPRKPMDQAKKESYDVQDQAQLSSPSEK